MADLTGVNDTLPVRLGGVSLSSGLPDNYADVNSNAQLLVAPSNSGPVTPGTAASNSGLAAGQYNTTLPTLTATQQAALQLDSSGRLITNVGVTAPPSNLLSTGTLTGTGQTVTLTLQGTASINIDVSGPGFVGTITVTETTPSQARTLGVFALNASAIAMSITANGNYRVVGVPTSNSITVAFTAYTSGSAIINIYGSTAPYIVQPYSANAANVLVTSYLNDGNGNIIGSSAQTGASLYTIKPDSSTTGTLGALNATLNLPINDVSSAYALISGTWVGTIQFQGSVNGTNFVPLEAVQGGPTNAYSTAGFTANGGVRIALPAGFTSIQAVMTSYTSGTATVVINASAAPANVEVVQFNAANLNASIGSIVTDLDKTITGTITALNGTVVIAANGTSSVNASVSGTWVATLVMEGQSGDGIWYTLAVGNPNGGLNISSFTTNNLYTVGSGGFTQVRIRASAYTSGTVNVTMDASSGSAQTLAVDANGNQQIVGNVASGTADSGNGVKTSAVYNSTLPTFTNGQRADNQSDANGAQLVSTKVPRTYSAPTTALINTTSTLILAANANRKGLYLSNTTTQQISLGFSGNAAVYQNGLTLFPGEKFWMDEYSFSTGAVYAITSGSTTYIGIQEIT